MAPRTQQDHDVNRAAIRDERLLAEMIDMRFAEMQEERRPYEEIWREIVSYVLPEREYMLKWYEGAPNTTEASRAYVKRIGQNVNDSTPVSSLLLLAAGIQGYVVSEQDRWFRLEFSRPDQIELPGAREWLQEAENAIYMSLSHSNFYSEISPLILDAASVGTATMRSHYDEQHQRSVYATLPPSEVYIAQNDLRVIDTVFRQFSLTRRNAILHFGKENLSRRILESKSYTDKYPFVHAVFPRTAQDVNMGLKPRNLESIAAVDAPYISIYKEYSGGGPYDRSRRPGGGAAAQFRAPDEKDKIVSVGGFREFPYSVWRWDRDSIGVYGTSPCRRMLPQIRDLNHFAGLLKQSAMLHVRPPFMVPSTLQGQARLTPGAYNYFTDPTQRIEAITAPSGDYPVGADREDRLRQQVRETLGVDYFVMISQVTALGQSKTATEIMELQSEKAAVLASVKRNMGPDVLDWVIRWEFKQARERGLIPPAPDALQEEVGRNRELKIHYIGPLAQAQKRLATVQGPLRVMDALLPIFNMYPEGLDNLDLDEFIRELGIDGGLSPGVIRTHAEVQFQREQARARMEQQQQLEDGQAAASAYRNMAMGDAQQQSAPTVLPMPPAR